MSTAHQRARVAAIRAALASFRGHRQLFTAGYGLVVLGGASTPSTNYASNTCIIGNTRFDSCDFASPPSSPSPCTPLGRHLVAPGGAIALAFPLPIIPLDLAPIRTIAPPRRIFHLPPPCLLFIDASALVVPPAVAPHRVGVG
ncbi:hypothetical protein CYMTET_3936 [Cymbomonas tetramitiformis]|uniref:Uncharacterized protein n=1 Tax=Cymbomonas tetramitiformis TaxID=36881 RepID=A0AAE0H2M4_9CHLO|nr:hypothetical protein CYMTET_3936 [Cymbomonas tetramitiformis]